MTANAVTVMLSFKTKTLKKLKQMATQTQIELRELKLKQISRMIDDNLQFRDFIKNAANKFDKTKILDFLDTKFLGLDTFLNIYFDFVNFISPEQFEAFERYRTKSALTNSEFRIIFQYGDGENSGDIMFDRFTNRFNRNVNDFENHLCQIDRAKWDKFFKK